MNENGNYLGFTDDDYERVDMVASIARDLLKTKNLKPEQIIGLGNFLYVVERLPKITRGADETGFSLELKEGGADFREEKWIRFTADEGRFCISRGLCSWSKCIGTEFTDLGEWYIDAEGKRRAGFDLHYVFEEEIPSMLNLGAKVTTQGILDLDEEEEDEETYTEIPERITAETAFLAEAERNWMAVNPRMVAKMRQQGSLEARLREASKLTADAIKTAVQAGTPQHEAEAMAKREFLYWNPESKGKV